MKKKQTKKIKANWIKRVIFIGVILSISLLIRIHNYDVYPQRGATSDEYAYAFAGISLLTKHVPISWSFFPSYKKTDLVIDNLYFPIVQPFLDHPPIYSIIIGSWELLFGEDRFEDVTVKNLRIIPLILSFISSILLYLLTRKLYNVKVALWGLLIFSTVPIFIMNMRVGMAENFLSVLFLLAIYLMSLYKTTRTKQAILLGIVTGLAFLTKVVGVSLFVAILVLLFTQKTRRRYIGVYTGVFLICVAVFFLYGAYYDWNLFLHVQTAQASRGIGPQTLYILSSTPVIINKIFYDGWYFFGLFALAALLGDIKKHSFILIPSIFYFLLLLVSLTASGESGWYMIPLFPFMSIASAAYLVDAVEEKPYMFMPFLLFIGFFLMEQFYEVPFGLSPFVFRILVGILFIPVFGLILLGRKKWITHYATFLFYLSIFASAVISYQYIHQA